MLAVKTEQKNYHFIRSGKMRSREINETYSQDGCIFIKSLCTYCVCVYMHYLSTAYVCNFETLNTKLNVL